MQKPNTHHIDRFISNVQLRLILKFVVLPALVLLILLGTHFFAEGGIDRLRWSVPLGWPLNTWYFWGPLVLLVAIYAFLVRRMVSLKGTCDRIDDFYAPHSDATRSRFVDYHQKRQMGKNEVATINDLNRRLRNEDLYAPRRIVPLWNWKWFWRMLIILLLLWLLLMLFGPLLNSPMGLLPGPGATQPQESLEEKASEAAENSHSESSKSTANEVKQSARKINRRGMDQEEKQELLEQEEDNVRQEQERLEGGGKLYENLSRAANQLSEEPTTREAGKSLFRRNPTEAIDHLKNLPQQTSNPAQTAEAVREAGNALEEIEGMENLGQQFQQLAQAIERGQPLDNAQQQALEQALQQLQHQLDDAQTMKTLRQDIREEMRRQRRMNQAQQQQQRAEQQMIQTLEQLSDQAGESGERQLAQQMQQLSRGLQRGVVSPAQLEQQLEQIENQMQQAQMTEMQQELSQASQELQTSLLEYHHAINQRQKIEGPLEAEKFELNPGQDSAASPTPPANVERILSQPQVGDSRVPRPQNTNEDLELLKNVYDKRKQ